MKLPNGLTQVAYDAKMKPFIERRDWNWSHLLDFKTPNPYTASEEHGVDEPRIAIVDLFHSIKNVWKESRRLQGKSKWIPWL